VRYFDKVRKTIKELHGIRCDFCKRYIFKTDSFELQEIIQITHSCGYASIFGDGNEIHLDICQHCLKRILKNNKIKIKDILIENQI